MLKSIVNKEWLKVKYYYLGMVFIILGSIGYFWFNLNFEFSTLEPESMMWYKFAHLQDKPYFYLANLFMAIGVAVSLVQFIPERVANRVKIMAHLPLSLRDALFYHLFIGGVFVVSLCIVLGVSLVFLLSQYYPSIIIHVAIKDVLVYSFASVVEYLILSSVILEYKPKIIALKLLVLFVFTASFLKEQFVYSDSLWLLFFIFAPFMVLDSFYSVKQQRLQNSFFMISAFFIVIIIANKGYLDYKTKYQKEFNNYYIFYSNVVKDFVYQKNFGKHRFEYGIDDNKTFDRVEYESYLPFVYWRNLDIQKKLPVVIDGIEYSKTQIKKSRLGFSYNPNMLNPLEVNLFPLFNPDSKKGMIKFPEEQFNITDKGVNIYDYDSGLIQDLSSDLTDKLDSLDFKYPALNVWGKTTNMKPYDKGYLIIDSYSNLFNIKRADNKIEATKISYPKDIEIAHIKISENKQKILSGYAIDTKNRFYLLTWDFKFIKLELDGFDYKTMKLKLISNPINYLIRYDDSANYYSVVFTKEYQKIKEIVLD